jgi:MFS family permease
MTTLSIDQRPPLISGRLLLVFTADFAGLTSFYMLLAVVPQYAIAAGGGVAGAGFATTVLMLSTVAAELAMPWLVRRFGYRAVLAAGLTMLGVPALALPASVSMTMILVVSVLRGFGLAVIFVVCGELSAMLVPPERRGEGLGVFGIVAGLPAVIAMPLGLWLLSVAGFPVVFVVGGLLALAGLAVVPGVPDRRPPADQRLRLGGGLLRPAILFAATAMAAGIVATFLPVALRANLAGFAALALLAQAAIGTLARWWAGRFGDRHGPARLLVPGLVTAAAGVLMLALVGSPVAVMAGALLFGAGFGVVQNASLAVMYDRAPRSAFGTVTAIWSVAYDGGWGLGTAGFGLLAAQSGYGIGFAVTAAVMVVVGVTSALGTGRSRAGRSPLR